MTFDPLPAPPLLSADLPGMGARIKTQPGELRSGKSRDRPRSLPFFLDCHAAVTD
jgi:hypothetical protein